MTIPEKYNLSAEDIDRIVEMAWEDRTPFDAIKVQFGLPEADVIQLMQQEMHPRNWRKWRARVQSPRPKHPRPRDESVTRFKSRMQRGISSNRISKRK